MDKATQTENVNILMLSKNTLNLLLCKQCKKYLSSAPVYSFEDGTNMCECCYHKEPSDFKEMKHICNVLYANTVKEIDFPCQYSSEGCEGIVRFDRQYKHYCMYAKIFKCPVAKDGFNGTIKAIQDHLKSQHENILFTNNEICFTIKDMYELGAITVTAVLQQQKHYFTTHKRDSFKRLKVFALVKNRVFVVVVDASYNDVYLNWELGVAVSEVTYEKCRGTFTVVFKQQPNFILIRSGEINTHRADSCAYNGCVQNLNSLFEMSANRKTYCTISLDIQDRKSLVEIADSY